MPFAGVSSAFLPAASSSDTIEFELDSVRAVKLAHDEVDNIDTRVDVPARSRGSECSLKP